MKKLFTVFALFFSSLVCAMPLNKIVIFGDSLSDNGNLYKIMDHMLPKSPPYFAGRFSNGHVWIEHLARFYFPENTNDYLFDYAFGGAGVSEKKEDEVLITLKSEIDTYLQSHENKADPNSLFVVWIGSNNYLSEPDNIEQSLNEVNTGITHGLQRLSDAGAKHVLVVNMPDLGKTPLAREFEMEKALTYVSKEHNQRLLNNVKELQKTNPNTQWIFYDVESKLNELLDYPSAHGFNNITDICCHFELDRANTKSNVVLQLAMKIKPNQSTDVCEGHLFFDPVHPTVAAHEILAKEAKNLLDNAGVEFAS